MLCFLGMALLIQKYFPCTQCTGNHLPSLQNMSPDLFIYLFFAEWHVDSGPCLLFALDGDVCFVHLMFWSFQFAISISIYFSLAFQADGSLIKDSCLMWGFWDCILNYWRRDSRYGCGNLCYIYIGLHTHGYATFKPCNMWSTLYMTLTTWSFLDPWTSRYSWSLG